MSIAPIEAYPADFVVLLVTGTTYFDVVDCVLVIEVFDYNSPIRSKRSDASV